MSNFERRKLARVNVSDPGDEIVISGMAGRFPNSSNVADFRYNLYNKIDMVDEEERRWKHLNEEIPKRYGKTVNLEKFDATFFSIHYRQAHSMDPQARILQEHAYEAIIDAGIAPKSLCGSRTGVFIGCCNSDADEDLFHGVGAKDGLGLTGTSRALIANRISFAMDFKGPSFVCDTACSSSGYALDLAFNAFQNGECDYAIVGGSNLLLNPLAALQFFRLGVLSKDGYCRPFDKDASGYSRSEALNVLFLQKKRDAKRIYANLVYSKTNVDGFKNEGLTYPSSKIQIQLLQEFYNDIGMNPVTIDYVEAHSTGTKIGDPEECHAIDKVFCTGREKPLLVGSVKSNMGHSEASSSICSIIKSLIIFENGKIPANLHFKQARPDIPSLEAGRLKVVSEVQEFNGSLISVNSFGFGGANSHCLLKINSKSKINHGIPMDQLPRLLLWSGRTEDAVNVVFDSLLKQPLDAEYIALLQNTQVLTPSSNTYRGYGMFVQNPECANATCIERHVENFASSKRPIVWVYSGMGSQWSTMGADLMKIPLFESSILKCHNILAENGINLIDILMSSDPKIFDNILHSFVAIAAVQIGLTNILKAIGLVPDYIVGHSVGELGCAYADGCITDEEMILSAYSRGMASLETKVIHGSMAAVGIGYNRLKDMLIDGVEIACHNSSDSCTISGPSDIIAEYVNKLKIDNYFAKEVQCSNIPYHSSYISEMGSKLLYRLEQVMKNPKERSPKWISSSVPSSNWDSIQCKYSSALYHTNNLLSSVLFEEACENLPQNAMTIEIAPHGLLQAIMKRSLPDGLHFGLTKRGSKENSLHFLDALGKIFENGVDMDISQLYPQVEFPVSRGTPMISPLVKWDHNQNWFVPRHDDKQKNEHMVLVSLQDSDFDFISGHEIDGRVLFPATGYLYLAWTLAAARHKQRFSEFDVEFEDIKFLRACNLQPDQDVNLTVLMHRGSGKFEVSEGNTALVTGFVRPCENYKLTDIDNEDKVDVIELESKDFYKELRLRGYHYKNLFKSVMSAKMDGSCGKIKWHSNWIAFLDCLLQFRILAKDTRSLVLPIGIKKMVIKQKEHLKIISELNEDQIIEAKCCADLNLLRCGGIEIRGLQAQAVNRRPTPGIPVLESYQFVPHFPTPLLSKIDAARFCVQLALENLQISKIFSAEIDMNDGKEPLSEYFGLALGDLPLVTLELNYLTSKEIEIPQTSVTNSEINSFNNSTFVIRSNCLFDINFMETIASQLGDTGYVISREPCENKTYQIDGIFQGFQIIAVISLEDETLIMIQYNKIQPSIPSNVIKIDNSDNNYLWLNVLKEKAKTEPTIVYAENEELSGIIGLVNCIRKEPSGSGLCCVFIDDKIAPSFDVNLPFYKNQLEKGFAINVYRNGEWGSYKHFSIKPSYEKTSQETCCYANELVRGDLSSFRWLESPLNISRDDSKEFVKVQYATLNFRDVMLATGRLANETVTEERLKSTCVLGFEFAGVTKYGRRVMGVKLAGALASHVEADDVLLWDCPDDWTLDQAATIPCVYATVYAAFFVVIKIQEGKSILIHAGTGGVGLAAIRVAFAYGLEVFTTVSTEEKKKFLLNEFPQLKRENIGNSRDTSFEDLIMTRTRGKGVDYVLNSLSEEKLLASVRCLGEGGKFLEIGKFDMVNNNKLALRDFLREISFHSVMVDNLFKTRPDALIVKMLLKKLVQDDLKRGIIKPLNKNIFNADDIEQAVRLLASGKHIGKVVIKIRENEDDNSTIPISVLPRVYCNPHYSYVICGGLGGVGLELADWLILRGCRKLVLSTSRGITRQYQAFRIRLWETYGVKVLINKSDITTRHGCEHLINEAIELGDVGGIFNLAVKLRDSLLENQNISTFDECMAPKAYATKYLDDISRAKCPLLQYFVVFSSVSCGRGNAGQSNYGMANSVMERIMEQRAKLGFPAKAIQWGAIGEVGIVADLQEDKLDMEIGGTLQQRISSCLEELDTLMTVDSPIVSSMVVAEKKFKGSGKGGIIEMIMHIMSIKDIKSLSLETKLSELGMDSLMTVEIAQALEREFNLVLTTQELRSMTLQQLKALESNASVENADKSSADPITFLLRNLGDESKSHETILKLDSMSDEKGIRTLIIPGIESVCGNVYSDLAKTLKYPTYLLQTFNCWNAKNLEEIYVTIIDDVLKLFENETTFMIIAYSYGSMLALKIAKALENLGKTGKVIILDGSPELVKRFVVDQFSPDDNAEELIQATILKTCIDFALPNDSGEILKAIISERGWDAKMKKLDELYNDIFLYTKDYSIKICTSLYNRMMMLVSLDLKSFPILESPMMLVKPSIALVKSISNDYGLNLYVEKEIDIRNVDGDHMTILENPITANIINDAF